MSDLVGPISLVCRAAYGRVGCAFSARALHRQVTRLTLLGGRHDTLLHCLFHTSGRRTWQSERNEWPDALRALLSEESNSYSVARQSVRTRTCRRGYGKGTGLETRPPRESRRRLFRTRSRECQAHFRVRLNARNLFCHPLPPSKVNVDRRWHFIIIIDR